MRPIAGTVKPLLTASTLTASECSYKFYVILLFYDMFIML